VCTPANPTAKPASLMHSRSITDVWANITSIKVFLVLIRATNNKDV